MCSSSSLQCRYSRCLYTPASHREPAARARAVWTQLKGSVLWALIPNRYTPEGGQLKKDSIAFLIKRQFSHKHPSIYCRSCDAEKNWYYDLTVATLVARSGNETVVTHVVASGGFCLWREPGVMMSILWWCTGQKSGLSHRENVITFNLVHKEILLVLSFYEICEECPAINWINFITL
jgi:hypothetical protein